MGGSPSVARGGPSVSRRLCLEAQVTVASPATCQECCSEELGMEMGSVGRRLRRK